MTVAATIIIPSNPVDQVAIFDAIKEIDDCMSRMDSEKEHIKAIQDLIHEKYEVNKGLLMKMARVYHKQNFEIVEQEYDDFQTFYETVVK